MYSPREVLAGSRGGFIFEGLISTMLFLGKKENSGQNREFSGRQKLPIWDLPFLPKRTGLPAPRGQNPLFYLASIPGFLLFLARLIGRSKRRKAINPDISKLKISSCTF
jgi:hypothetical protein